AAARSMRVFCADVNLVSRRWARARPRPDFDAAVAIALLLSECTANTRPLQGDPSCRFVMATEAVPRGRAHGIICHRSCFRIRWEDADAHQKRRVDGASGTTPRD